jgi:catechol 2,3-dioxygenase-like lactoylglutathione lyase family enzyme
MTQNAAPQVTCDRMHAGLTVGDIKEAVDFYTQKLGFTLGFFWGDPPDMAGVNLGNVSVHLFKGQRNAEPERGARVYFVIENVDELYEFHRSNGVDTLAPPANQVYELRDYLVKDPYGNILGFGQYMMSTEPKLKIERVEVPLRLEKRLAALVKDLAEHKGMNIDSTLEETLLHTFEPYGGGVASPHTQHTLRHIQELKKKHGIDYDCHASYRFEE